MDACSGHVSGEWLIVGVQAGCIGGIDGLNVDEFINGIQHPLPVGGRLGRRAGCGVPQSRNQRQACQVVGVPGMQIAGLRMGQDRFGGALVEIQDLSTQREENGQFLAWGQGAQIPSFVKLRVGDGEGPLPIVGVGIAADAVGAFEVHPRLAIVPTEEKMAFCRHQFQGVAKTPPDCRQENRHGRAGAHLARSEQSGQEDIVGMFVEGLIVQVLDRYGGDLFGIVAKAEVLPEHSVQHRDLVEFLRMVEFRRIGGETMVVP